jgi:hypothetical protein
MTQDNSPDVIRVTVGCLFAAIGGFCKAFQQKGANILWANETDDLSVHGDRLPAVDVLTAGASGS